MNKNHQSVDNRVKQVVWIVIIVGVLILGATVTAGMYLYTRVNNTSISERNRPKHDGNLASTSDEALISRVVDAASPSVVSIMTNVSTRTMFGAAQQQAAGTGVVVSADGYILTNKHVVSGATAVTIVMSDGTIYEKVSLVGVDPLNDIAYLKIDGAKGLKPASLGDSSTVRVGQGVIAIGNALGQYQNTVSSGIISGKGRPVNAGSENGSTSESLSDLLQTDAAINPGNSGGPLLNRSGQVIGINTAVAANAEGIGFAIPINAVKGTLASVISGKGVQRSYIGLRYVPVTPAIAKRFNLPVKQGAYVVSDGATSAVETGGPADKAGISEKDIITNINGASVGEAGGVSTLIGAYAPGETVTVTYLRGGSERTTKVTLATYRAN